MPRLPWIDGHLDLAYLALRGRDLRVECADANAGCVSLPDLRRAGVALAFATIFTEPGSSGPDHPERYPSSDDLDAAEAAGLRQIEVYEQLEATGDVSLVHTAADLTRESAQPKTVILMEGADPIRSPEHVTQWRQRGVRIVGLTWAAGTRYAGGNGPPPDKAPRARFRAHGLTALGIEMVRALDQAGIIHDVSHLSDRAFDGLLEHARGPIIASHSNCRALVDNWQRHLRDDQIRAIGSRGGIVGLNLFSRFLAVGRRATIHNCLAHLEHIVEIMGHRRGVALGSDMDGGFAPKDLPEGLDHPAKLPALADALRGKGWSDDEVNGFTHGNWERLLRENLP